MNEKIKTIPRELIAFAFVEDEYSRTGDITRGLMPLFNPILAKKRNQIFEPAWFAREVEFTYDIPMSTLVAEGLVPQLADIGLLYQENKDSHIYRISTTPDNETRLNVLEFDNLVKEFISFCSENLLNSTFSFDNIKLENALLKRFTSLQFLSILQRPEKNYYKGNTLTLKKEEEPEELDEEQHLDILCANFALHMLETQKDKFDLLTKIASGALIAEVVLTLQRSIPDDKLADVSLLLDGPLLLDYLDLSTVELKEFATDLFKLIEKLQIKKVVFQHTIEEMKGTIYAPLECLQRGDTPFGPLGDRINNRSQSAAYARSIYDDIETKLEGLGISIIDAETYETEEALVFCTKEMEESIRNSLGRPHENLERRIKDAKSVATILRMRGKKSLHPQSITEAKFLLVTRNESVAKETRKHLIFKKQIDDRDFPPTLTDRQLAGLLWFAAGGNLASLSSKKLIANCSYVMHPKIDIISKLRQCLTEINEEKAEIFTVLMRDQRAQRCLVQRTFGFTSAISSQNAEQILEELRSSTADLVRREAQEKENRLRVEQDEKLQNTIGSYQSELLEKESTILELTTAQKDLIRKLEIQKNEDALKLVEFKQKEDSIRTAYLQDIDSRMQEAVGYADKQCDRLKLLLILLYVLIIILNILLAFDDLINRVISTVILTLLAFWFVPEYIFKSITKKVWKKYFLDQVSVLKISDQMNSYDIDYVNGKAKQK